ncbi:MAG: hypothetical protein H0Z32_05190 [Bacillaceae bacterium]|nr:hypothetical protein [Bacillaceae bacterium]
MINRGLIILIGWLLFLTACNQQESSSIKDFYPSIHAEELILKKDYESFQEMLSDSSKQDINETDFPKIGGTSQ